MSVDQLTVMVLTWNERDNIKRTLDSLKWASNVLVVDSFSDDGTLEILQGTPGVKVIQRAFTDFADQCNEGLRNVTTPWVLSIDADYVFPPGSREAIEHAMEGEAVAYQAAFIYAVHGKPIRGSILPPRAVLFRRDDAVYENEGHGHRVRLPGPIAALPFKIVHDDRKPLDRWLRSQLCYARQDAEAILAAEGSELSGNDRIRRLTVVAPWAVFILVYFLRGGFLNGWRGLFYALQRLTAELLLSLFLIDARLRKGKKQ